MLSSGNSKISFRAIEVFIAAVEEGAITLAAKRLGASPSAVSLQLSNLEKSLGTKLVERSSQRFALTPAGEIFHPRAIRILDEVSSATAALTHSAASPHMVLKLAIIEDFDTVVMPPWLSAIRNISPNIRFHVKSGPSHESYAALENRSADMIVAVESSDAADWIESHPILQDPYILVRSGKIRTATSMKDLMRFPFIRYSREQHMGRQIEAQLRRTGTVPPREHEFSSNQAVFSMVQETSGWTITSASAFASLWFTENVDKNAPQLTASQVPLPSFSRIIALYARKGALGDLPATVSAELRKTLETDFVEPLQKRLRKNGIGGKIVTLDSYQNTQN